MYAPRAPLLILIGADDDWTPAPLCQRLAEASRQHGHPVELTVYPEAHHGFDSAVPVRYVKARVNPNASDGRGATLGGNAAAWEDATARVLAFFDSHLRAPR